MLPALNYISPFSLFPVSATSFFMFVSFYSCDVTFFLHSPCILLCFFPPAIPASCISCIPFPVTVSMFDTRFFSQLPLCATVSDYPLWSIVPTDSSVTRTSHSYTFTILTNLAPLAIKLHPTYTCNPHFHVLPGCHSLPYLSTPITCLLSPLIFIFFLITSHGTNIPISLSSFSSLYSSLL
ncbi:uncharacterized protein KLLA0_B14949g [Kluyveromyces lactis]|uniref:KLLA0B14949p n=1 Tax=Kluyveromyces lactis (strain ATCC 8585 / CBS 2359 / DSM 70799 / NBRC 1267 / NRRL Y-1140 / WM37) TaxID=284590 RepID=Q6CV41_KLULA|nr:uncharacterized protein KLLA0_B14949g [Kluyveromyces lactis]CAH02591.1 KLLA0B14949p [Kluyveromyces lactis]|eukprot:XP_452198.1 uncharacterized protein KLLA0_B14949g [Kluyveromyces lactis]